MTISLDDDESELLTNNIAPTPSVRDLDYDGPLGSKGRREEDSRSGGEGISGEMIGGIVVGVLVVIAIVLLFVLVSRRRKQDKPVEKGSPADLVNNV